ncbi:alpha/beta hydrolase family protein [Pseudomonas fluorescens]|uniref:Alpha/beta hydrolase family protein n=1 Tax=Pseudomonas fluorescens TaxID=294 RepID=A0A0P8XR88_PSEFL|nr:alpha/beta hydrolase [Pseudomonas fluorescens]KPU59469.1 alpha/beta hydrolase family protein [Pseudomonas fluorescens]
MKYPLNNQSLLSLLGEDFHFPHEVPGQAARVSDFEGLKLNSFVTSDQVNLAYWEAGAGKPLIFIPGWSANGALYFHLMHILSQHYHVYVLDVRNQGVSEKVAFGNRISRYAMDVKEFANHLGVSQADYCGWSMGASILWAYIDLFGTQGIRTLSVIDQAPSIYCHADWTEQERLQAGAFTTSPERMIASYAKGAPTNQLISATRVLDRAMALDSPYFHNVISLAQAVVKDDMAFMERVLFDHVTNDWRDVIQSRIDVPTAIFTGEYSDWLDSQRWMNSVVAGSVLHVYNEEEQGDHFLALKNPEKFATDLRGFLDNC